MVKKIPKYVDISIILCSSVIVWHDDVLSMDVWISFIPTINSRESRVVYFVCLGGTAQSERCKLMYIVHYWNYKSTKYYSIYIKNPIKVKK